LGTQLRQVVLVGRAERSSSVRQVGQVRACGGSGSGARGGGRLRLEEATSPLLISPDLLRLRSRFCLLVVRAPPVRRVLHHCAVRVAVVLEAVAAMQALQRTVGAMTQLVGARTQHEVTGLRHEGMMQWGRRAAQLEEAQTPTCMPSSMSS